MKKKTFIERFQVEHFEHGNKGQQHWEINNHHRVNIQLVAKSFWFYGIIQVDHGLTTSTGLRTWLCQYHLSAG